MKTFKLEDTLPGAPPPPTPGSGDTVSSPSHRDHAAAVPSSPPLSVASRLPRAALHRPATHSHGPLHHSHRRRTDRRSTRAPPPRAGARAPPRPASQQPSPRPLRHSDQSPVLQRPPPDPRDWPRRGGRRTVASSSPAAFRARQVRLLLGSASTVGSAISNRQPSADNCHLPRLS